MAGVAATVAVVVWAVWFRGESANDYFPVGPKDRTWEYVVTLTGPSGLVWTGVVRTTSVDDQSFEGQKTFGWRLERRLQTTILGTAIFGTATGSQHFLRTNTSSLGRIGEETKLVWPPDAGYTYRVYESRWKFEPVQPVAAAPMRVGSSWEWSGQRTQTFGVLDGRQVNRFVHQQNRVVRIVTREAVTVPAGTFDALKFEIRTKTRSSGGGEAETLITEWRARNVGVVRARSEDYESELKSFNIPRS